MRKSFKNALPGETTLNKYVRRVDSEPGISETALEMLKQKVNESEQNIFLSLAVDDMAIRNNIWHDGTNIIGNTNVGDGPGEERATHAQVMIATCINGSWSIPCGYFFINAKFDSDARAELLKKLVMEVNSTDAVIVSIVMDNCRVNMKTLKVFGLDLNPDSLNSILNLQNVLGNPIVAIMDPPHLIKLNRSTLGDYETLLNANDEEICWKYLTDLHELQTKEGYHLGNKMRKQHIEYKKNRMKVKFATQVMSRSVSDALLCCEYELKIPEFDGAAPTADLLRRFDLIFDISNSSSACGSYSLAPLRLSNRTFWETSFNEVETYIRGLKHQNGQLVIKGRRSVGFVGWLINIRSFRHLFESLVVAGHMNFICTRKLQQDVVEHYFGSIRASLGDNNNPNCIQFRRAHRRLMVGALNRTDAGNCIFDDKQTILAMGDDPKKNCHYIREIFQIQCGRNKFLGNHIYREIQHIRIQRKCTNIHGRLYTTRLTSN